jgi:hypothetical protein
VIAEDAPDKDAMIKEALSAASPEIAKVAKVMDWEGNVLREGSDAWACYPTAPNYKEGGALCPMCLDSVWQEWLDAYANQKPFEATTVGLSYMLGGDCPVSNTDPYAEGPTDDNQWIPNEPTEGSHLMIIVPDAAALDGLPTDPYSGAPYVMWKGTPYQHIMVPTVGN